jgi:hypothetical protein
MRQSDLFEAPMLYEAKNLNVVCIHSIHIMKEKVIHQIHVLAKFAKKLPGYNGPLMEEEDISKTKSLFSAALVEGDFMTWVNEAPSQELSSEELKWIDWVNFHIRKRHCRKAVHFNSFRTGVILLELLKVSFISLFFLLFLYPFSN